MSHADGRFVAIVNDYGTTGIIYDLLTMRPTLQLDGGDYHPEQVQFAIVFVARHGRTVAIHRTDWNRLDASDAETGRLLTARETPRYVLDQPRPDHYLDYFHGPLAISPDATYILDDGWVWGAVGYPAAWDINAWLTTNVWESEDGASLVHLPWREEWDKPFCWLDAGRVAAWGVGEDESDTFDGARILSLSAGARVMKRFAGPSGAFFSDGVRLFSSAEDGLSIWDVEAGARTARIDGFRPTRQHRGSRELAEIAGRTLRRWRY